MEPIVLALASNERYFPGLYCAVASSLAYMTSRRAVDLRVLDGGISQASRDMLERLVTPQFLIPKRSDWRMTRCSKQRP
jgi:hypothetical protein